MIMGNNHKWKLYTYKVSITESFIKKTSPDFSLQISVGMNSYRIHIFFSLKIINSKNMNKNILEISDQNHINIEVTLLYFSTNQLKTQNKNILENSAQKLINRKIFRLQNK